MGLSIWNLFEAGLLVLNAICILNEERFLNKMGWGRNDWQQMQQQGYGQMAQEPGLKSKLLNLIHSVRMVIRIPLIFVNVLTIFYKLIAG